MSEKKVLIIEDEKSLVDALDIVFKGNGIKTLIAYDGESGLEIINSQKPDLVLLDIMMPKMDGFSLLKTIKNKKDTKDIPVIIISNLGQQEDMDKGKELGAIDYIIKSRLDIDEIVERIKKYL